MLLNLVKMRYGDPPMFVDIGSITMGYSQTNTFSVNASIPQTTKSTNSAFGAGIGGSFGVTPTINYSPLTGDKFAHVLMEPIPPSAILRLLQLGFRADFLLRIAVQSINSVNNRTVGAGQVIPANPQFYRIIHDVKTLQDADAISGQFDPANNQQVEIDISPNATGPAEDARLDISRILGIDPSVRTLPVVYGAEPRNKNELAILSRPMLQILQDLAALVSVPDEHVAKHYVAATDPELLPDGTKLTFLQIQNSLTQPANAFAAVNYQGYWFWIDQADLQSKFSFTYLLYLFTFVEPSATTGTPVLTIPVR